MEDLWAQIGNARDFTVLIGGSAFVGLILGAVLYPPERPDKLEWADWRPLLVGALIAGLAAVACRSPRIVEVLNRIPSPLKDEGNNHGMESLYLVRKHALPLEHSSQTGRVANGNVRPVRFS
jgi:hypothetical protein